MMHDDLPTPSPSLMPSATEVEAKTLAFARVTLSPAFCTSRWRFTNAYKLLGALVLLHAIADMVSFHFPETLSISMEVRSAAIGSLAVLFLLMTAAAQLMATRNLRSTDKAEAARTEIAHFGARLDIRQYVSVRNYFLLRCLALSNRNLSIKNRFVAGAISIMLTLPMSELLGLPNLASFGLILGGVFVTDLAITFVLDTELHEFEFIFAALDGQPHEAAPQVQA